MYQGHIVKEETGRKEEKRTGRRKRRRRGERKREKSTYMYIQVQYVLAMIYMHIYTGPLQHFVSTT